MRGLLLGAAAGVLALALTGSARADHHGRHHGGRHSYYGGRHACYGGRGWYYSPGWRGYASYPVYPAPLSPYFYANRWGFYRPYNPFWYPGCR
ncbi:MAG TPA: hypothetical protein VFA26_24085 [Gemmataceae bacterium]|nr:hypothetical protein [Gemmataceae bacterium]